MYDKLISIGIIIWKVICALFKKKPVDEERVRREFKRYDKAEDVYKDIIKIEFKIETITSKKCSRKALLNPSYWNRCESERRRLLDDKRKLIAEWERLARTPFTQRGASPG